MNYIALMLGDKVIYWDAIMFAAGAIVWLLVTLTFSSAINVSNTAVWILFPLGIMLSMFFSRAIYWYTHIEQFDSFLQPMTDLSVGGFCLPGVVLGVTLAAWIVSKTKLCGNSRLLDCAAPGFTAFMIFARLAYVFNDTFRSKIVITSKLLMWPPFASPVTDAAGNVTWRFAPYMVEAVLMAVFTLLLVKLFKQVYEGGIRRSGARNGDVARFAVILVGAAEIVIDSTRNDAAMYHFTFIKALNKYVSFVSLSQIIFAITMLVIFINFANRCRRANGNALIMILEIVLFLGFAAVFGYFGEYKVQRTGAYLRCYSIETASVTAMSVLCFIVWRIACRRRSKIAMGR